jgi:acyl-CoA thioesterase-1
MNWVVFQIASGRVFFVALALLVAAVGLRSSAAPRPRRGATWCLLMGLIGLSVAAAPLPTWAYAVMLLSIVAGWWASRFGANAATATATSALALLGVGFHEARYQIMPVLTAVHDRQIAVIGDSITAGHGESDLTRKWPAILRDRHGVAVEDFSKAGATAASAAKGLEQESIAAPVVIVEIGGNDFLGGGSVEDFEAGLEALLRAVCKPGRQVAMFELPIPPLYERFGRVQRDLASRHGVALIPKRILLSVIEAADATVDSLHLTQQGHDRMAAVVWALLEPAIREAAGQAETGDGADREGRRVRSTDVGLPIDGR